MAKPSRSTLLARKAMETKLALRLVCDTAALHRRLIRKDGGSVSIRPGVSQIKKLLAPLVYLNNCRK